MKNYFLKFLSITFTVISLFCVQSCTEPCDNVNCGDNGICIEGTCSCDAGYDGTDCNIVIRSLFTGVYDVEEICDTDPNFTDTYESSINESFEGPQFITINNLYNFESQNLTNPDAANVRASVSNIGGVYSLLIENQTITIATLDYPDEFIDFDVSGTGTYDPATFVITLEYSITDTSRDPFDPLYIDNCVQAYYPQ